MYLIIQVCNLVGRLSAMTKAVFVFRYFNVLLFYNGDCVYCLLYRVIAVNHHLLTD